MTCNTASAVSDITENLNDARNPSDTPQHKTNTSKNSDIATNDTDAASEGILDFHFLSPTIDLTTLMNKTNQWPESSIAILSYTKTFGSFQYSSGMTIPDAWLVQSSPTLQLGLENKLILQLGRISETQSPCGNNCTFITTFMGPYLRCQETSFTDFIDEPLGKGTILDFYSGKWTPDHDNYGTMWVKTNEINADIAVWNISITLSRAVRLISPSDMIDTLSTSSINVSLIIDETQQLFCVSGRAVYCLNTTYMDGTRDLSLGTEYLSSLSETCQQGKCDKNRAASRFEAMSMFVIVESMFTPLMGNINYKAYEGSYAMEPGSDPGQPVLLFNMSSDYTFRNGPTIPIAPVDYDFDSDMGLGADLLLSNGTIIADTRFNTNRDKLNSVGPNFTISEALLSEALTDVTLGTMYAFDFYNPPQKSPKRNLGTPTPFQNQNS
ncbi:hypothetical protein G7Y89_g2754 [Cudoniella acicularis]|uniref:Uncharacterized protein n=1 Tax=Cudoniella acicularis TaxID=354080 RepID=A0A8H4RVP7_9HELO|nr:hypothetical protein G7Y89_g2754 [Cudoniella acicularis]